MEIYQVRCRFQWKVVVGCSGVGVGVGMGAISAMITSITASTQPILADLRGVIPGGSICDRGKRLV